MPVPAQKIIHNAGIEPAYQDIKGGLAATVDDSISGSEFNRFNYTGSGWQHCSGPYSCHIPLGVFYNESESYDDATNDTASIDFTGTRIIFYGASGPTNGQAMLSIDCGSETSIDQYAATQEGNILQWSSPTLAAGKHTLKIRVAGTKNPGSAGTTVTIDRVDIGA